MRLVAISRVLDEADTIKAFVQHTAVFVDHRIFLDSGSKDGTAGLPSALKRDGISLADFWIYHLLCQLSSHLISTFLEAIENHGTDPVICLEADRDAGLRARLASRRDRQVSPSVVTERRIMPGMVSLGRRRDALPCMGR
jgi:hypothetical protein